MCINTHTYTHTQIDRQIQIDIYFYACLCTYIYMIIYICTFYDLTPLKWSSCFYSCSRGFSENSHQKNPIIDQFVLFFYVKLSSISHLTQSLRSLNLFMAFYLSKFIPPIPDTQPLGTDMLAFSLSPESASHTLQ